VERRFTLCDALLPYFIRSLPRCGRCFKKRAICICFFTHNSPTLIASRPRIVGATLKNVTTLIQFLPRLDVADAYLQRRQFWTGEYSKNSICHHLHSIQFVECKEIRDLQFDKSRFGCSKIFVIRLEIGTVRKWKLIGSKNRRKLLAWRVTCITRPSAKNAISLWR